MKRLEWLFHILAFSLQCGAIVPLLLRTSVDANQLGSANPLNTLVTGFVLAVVLSLMLRRRRVAMSYAPGMWPVLAVIVLAVMSTAWSDQPSVTIRRAASLMTVTLWAWYVVSRYDLKDVISIVRQSIGLLALASLVIAIVAPGMGRDDPMGPDGWRGVFAAKNSLGEIMAIGTITYLYCVFTRPPKFKSLLVWLAGAALCLGMLYLSHSTTALLVVIVGIPLCLVIRLSYKRAGVAVIVWTSLLLLIVPAQIIAIEELPVLAPMLGKDATLTGRVDLWLIVPSYIAQRPWLGYGFAGFWIQDSINVIQIWSTVGWEAPHSHNGWLDIMLELGVVGLALVVFQVVLIIVSGIRAVVEGREPDAQYVLLTTFLTLVYNLAESSLVRPEVIWVLLVIASGSIAKIAKQRRNSRASQFPRRFHRAPLTSPPGG
jgi:exopolysaccharide production protein ExoQ